MFANPYAILAALLFALGLFGSGVSVGYRYRDGRVAAERTEAAQQAAERARQESAVESAAALAHAKAQAAARAAARQKSRALELELAKDEAARTCRVSDNTYRLLNDTIRAANGAAPETRSSNAPLRPATNHSWADSGGLVPLGANQR